ncbi:transposase [Patescibacteria group bacterium]|nr:transposase [Patescibacteria group bacterium]MBU4339248.1 transposase [Patescibacteria group bacterium]MBU4580657.1 transposase [Patescibacteria group bacterium]
MKKQTPKQKASIVLAALRGEKVSKLSSDYQVHPNQINRWKKTAEDELENIFADNRRKENKSKDGTIDELYKLVGQREMEISWLKKKYKLELPGEIGFDK